MYWLVQSSNNKSLPFTTSIENGSDHTGEWAYPLGFNIFLIADTAICVTWSLLANSIVLISVLRDPKLHQAQNYYIASLAASDWMMAAFVMPIALYNFLYKGWPIRSRALCKFWTFMDFTNSLQSSLSVSLISYDRYCMVCKPVSYRNSTWRTAAFRIGATWTFSILFYGLTIMFWDVVQGYSDVPDNECLVEFEYDMTMSIIQAILEFLVPLALICYCNVRLWLYIRNRRKKVYRSASFRVVAQSKNDEGLPVCNMPSKDKRTAIAEFRREQRTFRNLLILVGTYFSLWIWYEIISNFVQPVLFNFEHRSVSTTVFLAATWPQYHLHAIDPIIYAITIERFRYHFKLAFSRPFTSCSREPVPTVKSEEGKDSVSQAMP
ncbi:histamine H3 receptor-like [Paramacrobiotus metropolitanus]|uniref:histamine H3 receptor-like n=1 Tax=Paramacrobiotus metropolitanus TaxID=2943436 RepID=UPI0024461118|nr:histamine H3 receptor-like [Paramacrobiotus metropolitanus]